MVRNALEADVKAGKLEEELLYRAFAGHGGRRRESLISAATRVSRVVGPMGKRGSEWQHGSQWQPMGANGRASTRDNELDGQQSDTLPGDHPESELGLGIAGVCGCWLALVDPHIE